MSTYYLGDNILFDENERFKEIVIKAESGDDYKFTIRNLLPADHKRVARVKAMELGGLPLNSFEEEDKQRFHRDAVVMVGIEKAPDGWDMDTAYSDYILNKIFKAIIDHTATFDKELKKNKPRKRGTEAAV